MSELEIMMALQLFPHYQALGLVAKEADASAPFKGAAVNACIKVVRADRRGETGRNAGRIQRSLLQR